jgi:hypothetical protein
MIARLVPCVLIASAVLTGCGASSPKAERGMRFVLRPGPDALADVRVTLPQQGPTHAPTQAEVRAASTKLRSFVNAHCPCELEETANGVRLLEERHR